jgi:sugar lactone lactonase YvrE
MKISKTHLMRLGMAGLSMMTVLAAGCIVLSGAATATVGLPYTLPITLDATGASSGTCGLPTEIISVAGQTVHVTVSGANPRADSTVTTDGFGGALYTYTGSNAGTDTITVKWWTCPINVPFPVTAGTGYPVTMTQTVVWSTRPGDTIADLVFGQAADFTAHTANNGGLSASSQRLPDGLALDSAGRLYVADATNNRVLEYDSPLSSQTAARVFGQAGAFTTNVANNGGRSQTSLWSPRGVAVDGGGRLYIADSGNNRVLEYDSPLSSQTANRVFGQALDFTTGTANNGGVSATSLSGPSGVAVDSSGRLYIADSGNNRVLEYDSPLASQTANRVFGQALDFATGTVNKGGVSETSLANPWGVAVDTGGHLFIGDLNNNRVLEYDSPLTSQTANRVFGQGGSFTATTANNGGISANSLACPSTLAVDGYNHLYVSDACNPRVLEYYSPLISQTANRVFGQAGSFSTGTGNNGGFSAGGLQALGVGVAAGAGPAGPLYIADSGNSRVLEYDGEVMAASVGGIAEAPDAATLRTSAVSRHGHNDSVYVLGAVVALILVASGAAGWRARRARVV